MKLKPSVFDLGAVALSTLTAMGSIGCLVTAFPLAVSLPWVLFFCVLGAAGSCLCRDRRVSFLPLTLWVVVTLLLFLLPPKYEINIAISSIPCTKGILNQSFQYIALIVTTLYRKGYGWPVLQWTSGYLLVAATPALCCLGCLISILVCRTFCRGRGQWFAIPAAFLPLGLCMVLTDTVPAAGYLLCLLTGVALLLLGRSAAGHSTEKLSAYLALPVALMVGLVLLLNPQAGYNGQVGAERLEQVVIDLFGDLADRFDLSWLDDADMPGTDQLREHANLRSVGPKTYDDSTVMELQTDRAGTVYLRGYTYDVYTGTNWTATSGRWNQNLSFLRGGKEQTKLKVTTLATHEVLYTGYVHTQEQLLATESGKLTNTDKLRSYEILCASTPVVTDETFFSSKVAFTDSGTYQFLDLPTHTQALAEAYLEANLGLLSKDAHPLEVWNYIAKLIRHVRNSATYSLQTPRMPSYEIDFAMWFLNESDTGYCIHFATAATVLLRAAGVPARYVTGYTVAATSGTTYVKDADAHAWVEVFLPATGWIRLDPTPGGSDSTDMLPYVTEPATRPSETTPTETLPPDTEPTEGTTAAIQTRPTGSNTPVTPEKPRSQFPWKPVLIVLGTLLALLLQWRLRVRLRRNARYRGKPNTRALTRWREVVLLSRLLKQEPDGDLHQIALKAKFSQHTVTREELCLFDLWLEQAAQQLQKKNILWQVLYGPILAIY